MLNARVQIKKRLYILYDSDDVLIIFIHSKLIFNGSVKLNFQSLKFVESTEKSIFSYPHYETHIPVPPETLRIQLFDHSVLVKRL